MRAWMRRLERARWDGESTFPSFSPKWEGAGSVARSGLWEMNRRVI